MTNLENQLEALKKENRQLQRENRLLVSKMNQFQDVSRIVAQEPDRLQLVSQLASHIAILLNAKRVLIGTHINGAIHFEQMIEDNQVQPLNLRVQVDEGVVGWVMTHKRSYLGLDGQGATTNVDSASILAVPILNHQRHLLGVIECHKPAHSLPFTKNDVAFIEVIALQIAPGLARALLFDQMERWTSSFENLLMFSASLNGRLEAEILIQRLVEHAAGFLGADAGFAGLTVATNIVSNAYWHHNQWHTLDKYWSPEEEAGTPGWVFVNQCPYLTNDYPNDGLADQTLCDSFNIKNALCVPIMDAREEVLGFVELHNKGEGREPFSWSDAHFLEALANSTAISLYNAYLLDELATQKGRLQALAARNLTLLEDERQRIARELHDETGQALIGIKLELQVLAKRITTTTPELIPEIDRLRSQVNESTAKIKEIARALRPPILDEMGLGVALKRLISDFQKHIEIPIYLNIVDISIRLPQPVETACYRIVQEALTNVVRHAQANQIWVALTASETLFYLCIQDDGCGFELRRREQAGLGLLGMQERVIMLDGTFTIETAPKAGTCINIAIPFMSDAPDTKTIPPADLALER